MLTDLFTYCLVLIHTLNYITEYSLPVSGYFDQGTTPTRNKGKKFKTIDVI